MRIGIYTEVMAHRDALARDNKQLREALEELRTYLHLKPGQDHTRHGEACGQDACILCLCEAVVARALGDTDR